MTSEAATVIAKRPSRLVNVPGSTLLRWALGLDAIATGANGVVYLAAGGALDSALGLSATLLRPLGAFLIAYAAALALVASRPAINVPAVWVVIVGNAAWAVGSLVGLAAGWISPTVAGGVWVVLQALAVAAFAAFQLYALRAAQVTNPLARIRDAQNP
jgi:hypothetical protein